ncbi:MAG: radical SAM family heme chaperone HemW [Maricaulaceae bacterium]
MNSQPLAIYVHWPYCARICPYCDFNVYKDRDDDHLVQSICDDLTAWRAWSGERNVSSVHFGGGTPSLMAGPDLDKIVTTIDRLWGLGNAVEIGLELNPNNAALSKLDAFKAAGVTRVSFGVQSFYDPALKQLGRDHDGQTATAALTQAAAIFPSVSADLIFGWHGQTESLLSRDLEQCLDLGLTHMSTYQLTIEDGTAFAKAEARGEVKAVDDDRSADFFDLIRERLIEGGFDHYEVSNFAKPDHRSAHNLAYWRGYDYVGVGPGAHGRLSVDGTRFATISAMRPRDYQERVGQGIGLETKESLSPEAHRDEYVLMGLRISEGISYARAQNIYDDPIFNERVKDLCNQGYLTCAQDRLIVPPHRRPLLNRITEKLLAG